MVILFPSGFELLESVEICLAAMKARCTAEISHSCILEQAGSAGSEKFAGFSNPK